jgi:hypothetical protein
MKNYKCDLLINFFTNMFSKLVFLLIFFASFSAAKKCPSVKGFDVQIETTVVTNVSAPQILTFSHLEKSSIDAILNISIVDEKCGVESWYALTDVVGVPVDFSPKQDVNGSITFGLPTLVHDGEYSYRLTVEHGNRICTIESALFNVTTTSLKASTPCFTPGAFQCNLDSTGFQQCEQSSDTLSFGDDILCAELTLCVQIATDEIACLSPIVATTETTASTCSTTTTEPTTSTSTCSSTTTSSSTTPTTLTTPTPNVACDTVGASICYNETWTNVCIPGPGNVTVLSDPINCLNSSCDSTTGSCLPISATGDLCVIGDSRCVGPFNSQQCVLNESGVAVWSDASFCELGMGCDSLTGLCHVACAPDSLICYTEFSTTAFGECVDYNTGVWTSLTQYCSPNSYCGAFNGTMACVDFSDSTSKRKRGFWF